MIEAKPSAALKSLGRSLTIAGAARTLTPGVFDAMDAITRVPAVAVHPTSERVATWPNAVRKATRDPLDERPMPRGADLDRLPALHDPEHALRKASLKYS